MNSKEIAKQIRNVLNIVEEEQRKCQLNGLEIQKYRFVIDHLNDAIDLLDIQEPWV